MNRITRLIKESKYNRLVWLSIFKIFWRDQFFSLQEVQILSTIIINFYRDELIKKSIYLNLNEVLERAINSYCWSIDLYNLTEYYIPRIFKGLYCNNCWKLMSINKIEKSIRKNPNRTWMYFCSQSCVWEFNLKKYLNKNT